MLPITDSHQHLWDLSQQSLPWLDTVPALSRSFTLADYLDAAAGQGIHRSVYVEVDVAPDQRRQEVASIGRLCEAEEGLLHGMVASADPGSADFAERIAELGQFSWVRGVRRVLHTPDTPPQYCLTPEFVEGVQRLGDLGLSFDLCVRPSELDDAASLVERCPGTQFIVDHCGNADPVSVAASLDSSAPLPQQVEAWKRGMQRLAALPNVACKLSGVAIRLPVDLELDRLAPCLDYCIDLFGVDRVLFGSDWPVCTLRTDLKSWVQTARQVVARRPVDEQRKILDANAARVYRLE